MNTNALATALESIRYNLGGIEATPITKSYQRAAYEAIDAAKKALDEKPVNLLTHLTSLTVAERETILRVAEMSCATGAAVSALYDGEGEDAETIELTPVQAVIRVIRESEAELRKG